MTSDLVMPCDVHGDKKAVVDSGSSFHRIHPDICAVLYGNIHGPTYVKGEGWIYPKASLLLTLGITNGDDLFAIRDVKTISRSAMPVGRAMFMGGFDLEVH